MTDSSTKRYERPFIFRYESHSHHFFGVEEHEIIQYHLSVNDDTRFCDHFWNFAFTQKNDEILNVWHHILDIVNMSSKLLKSFANSNFYKESRQKFGRRISIGSDALLFVCREERDRRSRVWEVDLCQRREDVWITAAMKLWFFKSELNLLLSPNGFRIRDFPLVQNSEDSVFDPGVVSIQSGSFRKIPMTYIVIFDFGNMIVLTKSFRWLKTRLTSTGSRNTESSIPERLDSGMSSAKSRMRSRSGKLSSPFNQLWRCIYLIHSTQHKR